MTSYYRFKAISVNTGEKMQDCIFCKIAAGAFDTEFVHETENVVVFRDLNPQAPEHLLVIPRKHYESLNETDDVNLLGEMLFAVKKTTEKLGLKEYRAVINTGKEAGQSVWHVHIHILSGRQMLWPPG